MKILYALVILTFATLVNCLVTAPIYPVADTYLNSNASTQNFGTASTGYYNRQSTTPFANQDLLAKFNVSQIPSTLTEAYIVFNQLGISASEIDAPWFEVDAWTTVTNWTESGSGSATWANPPTAITRFLVGYADGDPQTCTIPVIGVVQNAKSNGQDLISVRIVGNPSAPSVPVYMKETQLDSNKPYLYAVYPQ